VTRAFPHFSKLFRKQLREDLIFGVFCLGVQHVWKIAAALRSNPIDPYLFFGLLWHHSSPPSGMGARGLRNRLSCLSSGAGGPDWRIISHLPRNDCARLNIRALMVALLFSLTSRHPQASVTRLTRQRLSLSG
jgi:hypothetical protein